MNTYLIEFLNHNNADTCIRYSICTKKFYVSTTAEIKEGGVLTSCGVHADTIEQAIESFNQNLQGKLIVIEAYGYTRREILLPKVNKLTHLYK